MTTPPDDRHSAASPGSTATHPGNSGSAMQSGDTAPGVSATRPGNSESYLDTARRFLALSIPLVLSNVTVPLSGLADVAMLGHLESVEPLAGVGLATVLFDFLYWTFTFLIFATTATTARATGLGDAREVVLCLYRSCVVALVIGGLVLVLALPIREAGFWLLGGTSGVEAAGRDYYNARVLGAPAVFVNFAVFGWLAGRGRARLALLLQMLGAAALVGIAYVLLFVFSWGAAGSGAASALAGVLVCLTAVATITREPLPWRLPLRDVLHEERLAQLLAMGRDIIVRTFCLVLAYGLFTNRSAALGTLVLASNTLLLRLLEVCSMLLDGFTIGVETLAATLAARDDLAGVRRMAMVAFACMIVTTLTLIAVVSAAGEHLYPLLNDHAEVLALTVQHQHWMLALIVGVGLTYVIDGLLLGLHESRVLRNNMLIALLVFYMPSIWFVGAASSPASAWGALILFMGARIVLSGFAARRVLFRL